MEDDFDFRKYLLDILDPEERLRTLHESGWAGHPDFEDVEASCASSNGGPTQQLFAAMRRPTKPLSKSHLKRIERLQNVQLALFDKKRQK